MFPADTPRGGRTGLSECPLPSRASYSNSFPPKIAAAGLFTSTRNLARIPLRDKIAARASIVWRIIYCPLFLGGTDRWNVCVRIFGRVSGLLRQTCSKINFRLRNKQPQCDEQVYDLKRCLCIDKSHFIDGGTCFVLPRWFLLVSGSRVFDVVSSF